MPTTRTPRRRPMKFTPKAIAIFKRMMEDDCEGEDEYEKLDDELFDELKLKPWEGSPTIVLPGYDPVYPPYVAGGQWAREGGPKLYRELCAAAGIEPETESKE
jgi:hypothetical protein